MKQMRLIIPILFISLLFSCKDKDKEISCLFPGSVTFNIEDVEHTHLTSGRHIDLNPVMKIEELAVYDTLLLITGPSTVNDYRLHVYNSKDGTLLNSFVSVGRGPGELTSLHRLQLLQKRRELFHHDTNSDRAIVYSLDHLLEENISPTEFFSFNELITVMSLRLDSLHYVSQRLTNINVDEDATMMAGLYSLESRSLIARASFPHIEGMDSVMNRGHFSQIFSIITGMYMSYDDHSEIIVMAHPRTDLIEIFDNRFNRLLRIHGPDRFFPSFRFSHRLTPAQRSTPGFVRETWPVARSSDDVLIRGEDQRFAYSSPIAYSDGFYVLYSGELLADRRESGANHTLFFFHYDGTPQDRYTFDRQCVGYYAVDHARGIVYIVDTEYEIYAYNLPRR